MAAALLPSFHASWPIVISSPLSECLEFYPWNTMSREASERRRSPFALRPPAPLSSGLFKEWSATQQLFTAVLFRQNRFSNSPFYCGVPLRKTCPIGRHSVQAAATGKRSECGRRKNSCRRRTCMRGNYRIDSQLDDKREGRKEGRKEGRPWKKAVAYSSVETSTLNQSSLSSEP